jgi:hypothetical protein
MLSRILGMYGFVGLSRPSTLYHAPAVDVLPGNPLHLDPGPDGKFGPVTPACASSRVTRRATRVTSDPARCWSAVLRAIALARGRCRVTCQMPTHTHASRAITLAMGVAECLDLDAQGRYAGCISAFPYE